MTSQDVARGLPPDAREEPRRMAYALVALADALHRAQRGQEHEGTRLARVAAYVDGMSPAERLQALAGLQLLLPVFTENRAAEAAP
jgi:hypothetical protein